VSFWVVSNRVPMPVSGTSAACPTFAGILSLVNEKRLQAGKPSLGFVNPALYQNADALTDIVSGQQNGGDSVAGLQAVTGFDPVTGLGVANYEKMVEKLGAL